MKKLVIKGAATLAVCGFLVLGGANAASARVPDFGNVIGCSTTVGDGYWRCSQGSFSWYTDMPHWSIP